MSVFFIIYFLYAKKAFYTTVCHDIIVIVGILAIYLPRVQLNAILCCLITLCCSLEGFLEVQLHAQMSSIVQRSYVFVFYCAKMHWFAVFKYNI